MSSASPTLITLFGKTDDGRVREHNEDDFVVCTNLTDQDWRSFALQPYPIGPQGAVAMVADGMGGANAGEVASRLAAEAVEQYFRGPLPPETATDVERLRFMEKAILHAHDAIAMHAMDDPSTHGMGTTAVLCWVQGAKAYVAWSGDSRCYLLREGQPLRMLSQDHSLVWELVLAGKLTPAAAEVHPERNIITQSLGYPSHPPKPSTLAEPLQEGDRLLVCSDGLNSMLRDNQIEQILAAGLDPKTTCDQLVAAANYAGGDDNITVLLLDIVQLPGGQITAKSVGQSAASATPPPQDTPRDTLKTPGNLRYLLGGLIIGALIVAIYLGYFHNKGNTDKAQAENATPNGAETLVDTSNGGTGTGTSSGTGGTGTVGPTADTAAKAPPGSKLKNDEKPKPEEKPISDEKPKPEKPKVELNELKPK